MTVAGVILTSPMCGGTHAVMELLKGLGLKLRGRHRDGIWYPAGQPKTVKGTVIDRGFALPIQHGEFATGHSGPFPTDLPVICNLRDPRNATICHWKRHKSRLKPFSRWLTVRARTQVARLPRQWEWQGDNVLRVWYETIEQESVQREIAEFCGVEWRETNFYGHGGTWSRHPSDWTAHFDAECTALWDQLWFEITSQSWDDWWRQHGGP